MSKVIISNRTDLTEQNAALIAEFENRKANAYTRKVIFMGIIKAINWLNINKKNGKNFNKNIADHFKTYIIEVTKADPNIVRVRYDVKSNWNSGEYYVIEISVGGVCETFQISNRGRMTDTNFMLEECNKMLDIRREQYNEIAKIDIDQMILKVNKIRAAYELLGSELGDFVKDFNAMQYAFELDNNAAPKGQNFVFLSSWANR